MPIFSHATTVSPRSITWLSVLSFSKLSPIFYRVIFLCLILVNISNAVTVKLFQRCWLLFKVWFTPKTCRAKVAWAGRFFVQRTVFVSVRRRPKMLRIRKFPCNDPFKQILPIQLTSLNRYLRRIGDLGWMETMLKSWNSVVVAWISSFCN